MGDAATPEPQSSSEIPQTSGYEWLEWSQEMKDKRVDLVTTRIQGLLDEIGVSPEVRNDLSNRFNSNANRFREEIPGTVHDEYHMAKVTDWAIALYNQHKDKIPENKRKVFGLALVSAAMNHDMGDISKRDFNDEQEPFFVSQRSESESVRINEDFLLDFDIEKLAAEGIDKEELIILSSLLTASTCNDLEFDFDFSEGHTPDIENIGISNLIKKAFGEGEGYVAPSDKPRVAKTADIARNAIFTLKEKYGWEKNELLTAVRVMDGADYGAYFFEKSIQEQMALLGEFQEIKVVDGKLVEAPTQPKHYLEWLRVTFQQRIFDLYKGYFPVEAQGVLDYKIALDQKIMAMAETNKDSTDQIFRLESAFLPKDFLDMARKLGVSQVSEVQDALVRYSASFRQAQDNPDFSKISSPSSEAISAIFNHLDEGKRLEFVQSILSLAEENLATESTSAFMHVSPGRYESKGGITITQLLEKEIKENAQKYSHIKGLYLTYRQDMDDVSLIDGLVGYNLKGTDKETGIAVGGKPDVQKVKKALEELDKHNYSGNVMVHFGLESESDAGEMLKTLKVYSDKGMKIKLHLGGNYKRFYDWLSSTDGQEVGCDVVASPLINAMQDPKELDWLRKIEGLLKGQGKELLLSTNNAQSLSGGMAMTMERMVMEGK